MDNLYSISVGESVKVSGVEANDDLKQRLFSFGLTKGSIVKVKATSISKATIELEVGSTLFAIRNDEAKKIKVESL